ncbi:MAG: carbamoyltransferase C-terminal domain-containing protein [Alphaproteobacteria bacterium]
MLIAGLSTNIHDAAAALFEDFRLLGAIQLERLTRVKCDGGLPLAALDHLLEHAGRTRAEVDAVVLTRCNLPGRAVVRLPLLGVKKARRFWIETRLKGHAFANVEPLLVRLYRRGHDMAYHFDVGRFARDYGFRRDVEVFFCNHHLSHALPGLFFTDWDDDVLLYTADAGGDHAHYSAHLFRGGELKTLFGGEEALLSPKQNSLGLAYSSATRALGFRPGRHEGKVTGLAAYGEPTLAKAFAEHYWVEETGEVASDLGDNIAVRDYFLAMAPRASREDYAASIQKLLEDVILAAFDRLVVRHRPRRIGLSGGVFANVKLNQRLYERFRPAEIFVVPFMGDEGLAVGGLLQFLMARHGIAAWLAARRRLSDLYWAPPAADPRAAFAAEPWLALLPDRPAAGAARLVAEGRIGAVFHGAMEFGPRALGARSIIANPTRRETHDELNRRLARTEFMPFAPYVSEDDAARVFAVDEGHRYACRFMTITVDVRPEWRERIPAVVHVDGTARPQIIERGTNPLYYDILREFKELTGIPVLVNTSFNLHEEPIVNGPADCLAALRDGRIDFLATDWGIYVNAALWAERGREVHAPQAMS